MSLHIKVAGHWQEIVGEGGPPGPTPAIATGGTVTEYVGDGTNGELGKRYRVHTFLATDKLIVTQAGAAKIAVAAGGGGGGGFSGGNSGGGGGAGGLIYADVMLDVGEYEANVGAGGNAGSYSTGRDNDNAGKGGDSWLGPFRAEGGGGGGAGDWSDANPINHPGKAGGSGGTGGSYWGPAGAGRTTDVFGTYYGAQGNNGKVNTGPGGGAGSDGDNGGLGRQVDLTGTPLMLCAGGSGTGRYVPNSGDGGSTGNPASAGWSGIIIVRCEIAG